jgi:hypothetical protein
VVRFRLGNPGRARFALSFTLATTIGLKVSGKGNTAINLPILDQGARLGGGRKKAKLL